MEYYILRYRHPTATEWYYSTGYNNASPKLWTKGLAKNKVTYYESGGNIVELIPIFLNIKV